MCGIDGCLEFVSEQPLVAWLPWSSSDIAAILVLSGTSSPESPAQSNPATSSSVSWYNQHPVLVHVVRDL